MSSTRCAPGAYTSSIVDPLSIRVAISDAEPGETIGGLRNGATGP